MKKIILILVLALIAIVVYNCKKENTNQNSAINNLSQNDGNNSSISYKSIDEKISFYYQEFLKNHQTKEPPHIWKWIVAHAGISGFGGHNCGFNLPCGPCPGICLSSKENGEGTFIPIADDYLLTEQEYADGARLMQVALFNDSIMGITFLHKDFLLEGVLNVPENFKIGDAASNLFGKKSIIIKQGEYFASFMTSVNGTTLVNVICQ